MDAKIKLLIVDDELKLLNASARRLEMRGFDVTRAANGAEALEAASNQRFDVALLELKMPGERPAGARGAQARAPFPRGDHPLEAEGASILGDCLSTALAAVVDRIARPVVDGGGVGWPPQSGRKP